MSIEENKALILRQNDALNAHDLDALSRLYAPDVANHGRPISRDRILAVIAEVLRTFPDWHTTIDEIVAEGDVVVTRHTTTATHAGAPRAINVHNMLGIPPSGKPVVMRSIHIWHIQDGLIASHRAARDDLETMQQIGLWPPAELRQGAGQDTLAARS